MMTELSGLLRPGAVATRVLACALAVSLVSCREATPYEPPEPFQFHEQLTFGAGEDAGPTWTPDGEALLYYTNDYQPLPCIRGVMLTIPAGGGTAVPLLEDVQLSSRRALVAPALSLDGSRVAYFDLLGPLPLCRDPEPVTDAFLRVRQLGSTTNMLDDPYVQVFDWTHVTWAPDNQRVAFADSTGIHVWSIDDSPPVLIPNTELAETPAWSPTGDRIAFVIVTDDVPRILLTDTAGEVQTVIDEADGPAWSPDGTHIYARRGDDIVRLRLADGVTETIAGASFGRSPAPSPDGRRLAFVRNKAITSGDGDVWVIDLPL
jgi:Tol biopolymer transport system component